MKHIRYQLLLLLGAAIWGFAFVAQSVAADVLGPWTFNCLRTFIASITMVLLLPLLDKRKDVKKPSNQSDYYLLLRGGIICGVILTIAIYLQQYGIAYTTVGKAGFLSALYVIFVPIFSIFLGKKVNVFVWIAVILAMTGIYFLSLSEAEEFAVGDLYIFACAIVFTFHIIVVGYYAPRVDPIRLATIQFMTVCVVSFLPMILIEKPTIEEIKTAMIPILYAGVLSSSGGYTIQMVSQSKIPSYIASIIMSLESVFAALGGYLILHEAMTTREIFGAILVFVALMIAQIEIPTKKGIDQRSNSDIV